MPYDRPQQPGEDPISWALATGRVDETVAAEWRGKVARGEVRAAFIQEMAATHAPGCAVALSASGKPYSTPAAASTARRPAGAAAEHYELNPVLASLAANQRNTYAAAAAHNPQPPTLFESGDLPPFCASGVDPAVLTDVPWQARHRIAAEPNRAEVLAMIEEVSGEDGPAMAGMLYRNDLDNKSYVARVEKWALDGALAGDRQREVAAQARRHQAAAAAGGPAVKASSEMSDDEVYKSLFGDVDRAADQRRTDYDDAVSRGAAVGTGATPPKSRPRD